jgi:flagellar hook-associated protein 2
MSSSSITTSTVNGTTRVTGLSSGIDVDSIVEQLMTAEKAKKLNKLEQKQQIAEWQQDSYQSVISEVQAFADTYFDSTSSSSLLSAKNFKQYTVTSSDSAVSATATSAASASSHTIFVSQLATAATKSSSGLYEDVQGAGAVSYSSLAGTSFVLTVDETEYTVTLGSDVDTLAELQTAIDEAVGSGKLTVSEVTSGSSTCLKITAATDSGVDAISISAPDSGTSALSALGFTTNGSVTTNRLDTSEATLGDILGSSAFSTDSSGNKYVTFSINGESFTFYSTTVLDDMVDEINDSDCGATMTYDDTTGELVLTADSTGAGNLLTVSDTTGSFASTIFTASTAGKDAKFQIDGVTYTRSSNTVTVDGVTYTLNAVTDTDGDGSADSDETATVSLTLDTDGIYGLIESFVEDYNSLIATINDLVDEDYNTDYLPLTDDQKDSMTDEEITAWEAKAKTGVLEDDSLLKSFLSDLRNALTDSISSVSTSIFDIGIDTGDYDENGTLVIDEDALKEAIAADPEAILNLFTRQATSVSGTTGTVRSLSSSELATRYSEEGIAYRFYDIIAEYTSTTKDSSGSRGKLVEKAGLADSNIASDNYLSELIDDYEEEISDEEDRLDDYEESLYDQYTTLETYISNMNTQLTALSSYLNSSS